MISNCKECGKIFTKVQSQKYCSDECRLIVKRRKSRDYTSNFTDHQKEVKRERDRAYSKDLKRKDNVRIAVAKHLKNKREQYGAAVQQRNCKKYNLIFTELSNIDKQIVSLVKNKTKLYNIICEECGVVVSCKYENHIHKNRKPYCGQCTRSKVMAGFVFEKVEKNCVDCGSVIFAVPHQMYCDECSEKRQREQRRHYNRKKRKEVGGSTNLSRARYFNCKIERFNISNVFIRDKWTCQMCGVKTPQRLRGKNKHNSPELDHIIPLSKGGDHSHNNTQCLCRQCNIKKSNKMIGQLRIAT